MYYTYIIYSFSRDMFYVGHSGDLENRIRKHNEGLTKPTKSGIHWELVFSEPYETKSKAIIGDREILKMEK